MCTCCHTEAEVANQTCCLTQSQYTDTGPTSPRADPWPGRADSRVAVFKLLVGLEKWNTIPGSSTLEADTLPSDHRGQPLWYSVVDSVGVAGSRCGIQW